MVIGWLVILVLLVVVRLGISANLRRTGHNSGRVLLAKHLGEPLLPPEHNPVVHVPNVGHWLVGVKAADLPKDQD